MTSVVKNVNYFPKGWEIEDISPYEIQWTDKESATFYATIPETQLQCRNSSEIPHIQHSFELYILQ